MERDAAIGARYADRFRRLRVNTNPRSRPSPHKPCLLLAVLELAAHGALKDNRIEYSEQLRSTYERYRRAVDDPDRESGPWYPFFHLRSDRFWRLHPRPGREGALAEMKRATSEKTVQTNVSHASLEPALHALMVDPDESDRLRTALIDRWFPTAREAVARAVAAASGERLDRRVAPAPDTAVPAPYAARERPDGHTGHDDRFRRIVLAAYDYRCAASGWRVILPGSPPQPSSAPLIDAVRLVPRSISRDEASFGMALTPTYRRALESGLIAPGPDLRWRVSPALHERVADNGPLLDLAGRDVIFNGAPEDRPAPPALAWCVDHLRQE